jgi:hypothetical protein
MRVDSPSYLAASIKSGRLSIETSSIASRPAVRRGLPGRLAAMPLMTIPFSRKRPIRRFKAANGSNKGVRLFIVLILPALHASQNRLPSQMMIYHMRISCPRPANPPLDHVDFDRGIYATALGAFVLSWLHRDKRPMRFESHRPFYVVHVGRSFYCGPDGGRCRV